MLFAYRGPSVGEPQTAERRVDHVLVDILVAIFCVDGKPVEPVEWDLVHRTARGSVDGEHVLRCCESRIVHHGGDGRCGGHPFLHPDDAGRHADLFKERGHRHPEECRLLELLADVTRVENARVRIVDQVYGRPRAIDPENGDDVRLVVNVNFKVKEEARRRIFVIDRFSCFPVYGIAVGDGNDRNAFFDEALDDVTIQIFEASAVERVTGRSQFWDHHSCRNECNGCVHDNLRTALCGLLLRICP